MSLGLLILGSLTIGVGAMITISRQHQNFGIATRGYRQLHQLFDVGFLASKAREAISGNPPHPQAARAALLAANEKLDERSDIHTVDAPPTQWVNESARADCRTLISNAIVELDTGSQSVPSLNRLFATLSKTSGEVRQSIVDAQAAADRQNRLSLWFILGLCAAVLIGGIAIGIRQYRRVIGPLRKISNGVRAFAARNLDDRIAMNADREFGALANDFNQMADELAALYRDLEAKVAAKTKDLVRSEQLASVGYLAAGVAHEINNPLGIIAAYGERAIKQIDDSANDEATSRTRKALAVICEEAFRCKQITDRLLSLARPGSGQRQMISLATVTDSVVSTLAGLGTVRHRQLSSEIQAGDALVLADEAEMKQVLMNLIINALEAVHSVAGKVQVRLAAEDDMLQLSVADNGTGIETENLDRIFQPFITEKRGQRHGTGLGLSIAHAIVTSHGGRIWATSDGPGKGSVFWVELPLATKEVSIGQP